MKAFVTGFTEEKLNEVRTHPYFAAKLEAMKKHAETLLEQEPPRFKFSQLHLFVTTGNRSEYEKVYNNYIGRLNLYSSMYLLFGEEKYIEPLADIIWNICDLETWGLPAHVAETEDLPMRRAHIELCSASVGRYFGEILAHMEDKLPELVVKRMKHEVRERIVEGYKKYDFWWKHGTSNWSAVCIAGVLASYIYFATEEEIEAELPSMMKTMDGYLSGFDKDGCCMEGYGYWSYGFSYFCYFADLLRNYTNGKIDYFASERVENIAKFVENCAINDKQCIRFSDCGENYRPAEFLVHFLKDVYPDLQVPSLKLGAGTDGSIRAFMWPNPRYENSVMQPKNKIYHDAQWFIYKSNEYNFACKAGSNNEPHNHNDVGSFMISKDGKVTFTDPGVGEYTRQYFSSERYTILEPSARSHSLPIINGEYQVAGASEKSKIFIERENEYSFSMENAYKIETLTSLVRHFTCEKDRIVLVDTFTLSETPSSIVERFSTLVEPKIEGGKVYCGASVLEYNEAALTPVLRTETCVRSGSVKETLYLVDFEAKYPAKNMEFTFVFS